MKSSQEEVRHLWWAMSSDAVLSELDATTDGLDATEAKARLARIGRNALPQKKGSHWEQLLLEQFKSPLLVVLLVTGCVTLLLREWGDSAIILGAVFANALLGLYQERKAENTLALLQSYVKEHARVKRAGKEMHIDVAELVPGDIVRVTQGDRIPADGRILSATDVETDESILTGESLPVEKMQQPTITNAALADRSCMMYRGTTIVQGFADIVITDTGAATELGKIAHLVESVEREQTPLQQALLSFTFRASLVLAILTGALFLFGVYTGRSLYDMFLISVATAVSAVPEGLPIALTVILAVGVERLAKRKGVVRKLLAAETLGATTVILSDKTGTLTEARMELERAIPEHGDTEEAKREMLEYAVLHSDVVIENPEHDPDMWRISGRPVEVALVKGALRFGASQPELQSEFRILDRLPFNSSNKFAASILEGRGACTAVILGAPEVVLLKTDATAEQRSRTLAHVEKLAYGGERVLAIAIKTFPLGTCSSVNALEHSGFSLLGLISFRDPVRASVKDAVRHIGESGVRTLVVTGDHAGTAATVAREIGLSVSEASIMTGADIDSMSDEQLRERLKNVTVIARTTPEHKLRIAKAFKALSEVVAMTGDGVNDAPALKEANIGIAVGSASDVAKSAADLVILDNNFETIVAAIEEGRAVYQNIRKVIVYLLSNSFNELLLIGGSMLVGLPLPLNALQILWVNLFSDSFPAMALAFERHGADVQKHPANSRTGLFDAELKFLILVIGTLSSAFLFALYAGLLYLGADPDVTRTFIFASFGTYSLFLAFSVRSLKASIFSLPILSNYFLLGGVAVGTVMMIGSIYLPVLQQIFGTAPLSPLWVAGVIAVGLINIAAIEWGKWLFGHRIRA